MRSVYGILVAAAWGSLYGIIAAVGFAIVVNAAARIAESPASSIGRTFASRFDDEAKAITAARAVIHDIAAAEATFQAQAQRLFDGPGLALRYGVLELAPDGVPRGPDSQTASPSTP
jgi:hypothetical protein